MCRPSLRARLRHGGANVPQFLGGDCAVCRRGDRDAGPWTGHVRVAHSGCDVPEYGCACRKRVDGTLRRAAVTGRAAAPARSRITRAPGQTRLDGT